jgi:hypothetical protein
LRPFEVQFNRFLEFRESTFLSLALAGDIQFGTKSDEPIAFRLNDGCQSLTQFLAPSVEAFSPNLKITRLMIGSQLSKSVEMSK